MRARSWRGSVFKPADKRRLWIRVKVDGAWRQRPTPFRPTPRGQQQAQALLVEVRRLLLVREAVAAARGRPPR